MTDAKMGEADPVSPMELAISRALRLGVLVSAAVVLLGVLLLAWTRDTGYAAVTPDRLRDLLTYHPSTGPGVFPTTPGGIIDGVRAGRPYAVIGLGLLFLIATPVVRVLLSVLFFAAQADWLYVGITLAVLLVLVVSFAIGVG